MAAADREAKRNANKRADYDRKITRRTVKNSRVDRSLQTYPPERRMTWGQFHGGLKKWHSEDNATDQNRSGSHRQAGQHMEAAVTDIMNIVKRMVTVPVRSISGPMSRIAQNKLLARKELNEEINARHRLRQAKLTP